jgi:hypothetical protein
VLAPVPPWLVLAGLVGVINAAACFVLVGRHVSHLGWYVVLGALAAGLGQVFGAALQAPEPVATSGARIRLQVPAAPQPFETARAEGFWARLKRAMLGTPEPVQKDYRNA